MHSTETLIHVSNVSKTFKDVKAVQDVSLDVAGGEYLALLGPNGAGKTTLVEMIEGIRHPDHGTIKILGKSWAEDESHLRRVMGISLQETRFIDKLNSVEILRLFSSFYGVDASRIPELLDLVGLSEKSSSFTMNMSHGQRQKLALAIALLNHPKMLILDEPTTGLDPVARREIWEILRELKSRGTSLILTTHYMEEAEYLCDRIIIMNQGRILSEGTLDELLAAHEAREIISFTVAGGGFSSFGETARGLEGVLELAAEKDPGSGHLFVHDIVKTLPAFLALVEGERLELKRLECRKMNLDDLFVSLTGRRLDEGNGSADNS